jgi:medium-chain acyl-[acyl-carrier-protein] hydrolase
VTGDIAARWLPYGSGQAQSLRLICLPHAGAGASGYRAWGAGLGPGITACPVQLPGRESRAFEEPYRQMDALVGDLTDAIGELVETPYAVFGHSMGALVAFEFVRRIRRSCGAAPVHLFVAGAHAPHLSSRVAALRDLPACELATALHALGGTPSEVLTDPALLKVFAPLLRADFTVYETYRYQAEPPLDIPITAFAATADRRAGQGQVAAWRSHTSSGFQMYVLPGGHFAVLEHASFVHTRIMEALRCHVGQ